MGNTRYINSGWESEKKNEKKNEKKKIKNIDINRKTVYISSNSNTTTTAPQGQKWTGNMNIILLHNHYDADHLAEVVAQMRTLGAPKIKAVWVECYGAWVALEGCHRIRAARELGIVPEIDDIEYDEDRDLTCPDLGLDIDNPGATIGWIVDGCHLRTMISFGD